MAPEGTRRKRSARQQELLEVSSRVREPEAVPEPSGEVMAMLIRRGFRPEISRPALPFPEEMGEDLLDRFAGWFGHYGFRLFLRGALRKPDGFSPAETTRYLTPSQAGDYAGVLVELGAAERLPAGLYRMKKPGAGFGETLQWYVARELRRRFGFDTAAGVLVHARGAGGDFDVVAAGEGKLLYLELKSSPPKNLAAAAAAAFWERVLLLGPDLSFFVVDTALRLSDKVLPMLLDAAPHRYAGRRRPVHIGPPLWALTPHVYLVNGQRDLMSNIGRAIAAGLLARSPWG